MSLSLKIHIKRELLASIMVAIILYTNLVMENSDYIVFLYWIFGISSLYSIFLLLERPNLINKILFSKVVLWFGLFAIEMFLYGFFGQDKEAYSLIFHILHIGWIVLLIIILSNNMENITNILAKSSAIVIIAMSLFILRNASFNLFSILRGSGIERVGYTAVGNENTTAISYIFLLIPIVYKIGVEKMKIYIPIAAIGMMFMMLTGSKKGIISLVIMLVVISFGLSGNRTKLIKNIFKVIALFFAAMVLCYNVPVLHGLVWVRFESMINAVNNFNAADQSSTGLRMNYIITAFSKSWDRPFLGHGWASFASMYGYSSLYGMNLYTHNNYAEVLFSFGLLGFWLYYWFPVKMINETRKDSSVQKRILCWLYILIILFIDFGTVSCYSSILGYLGFIIVYLVLHGSTIRKGEDKR